MKNASLVALIGLAMLMLVPAASADPGANLLNSTGGGLLPCAMPISLPDPGVAVQVRQYSDWQKSGVAEWESATRTWWFEGYCGTALAFGLSDSVPDVVQKLCVGVDCSPIVAH